MRGFPARGRSHVENTLIGLWGKGNDGKERRSGLKHVMAGEVLGCSAFNSVRVQILYLVAWDLPIGTVLSKT